MSGDGDTEFEALQNLGRKLERYKLQYGILPRPGVKVQNQIIF
jgi:hypothetical protein